MAYYYPLFLFYLSQLTSYSSIVVEYLRRERAQKQPSENIGIAVLYLRYNDPEQTLENLLTSLLKQLAQEQDTIPSLLQELLEQHRDHSMAPSLEDITNGLTSSIETYAEVFFIVDALDECADEVRWELLENLRLCQSKVHLLITSRLLDSIGQELEDFERLEIKANKADLELFIDHRIQKNKNLRRVVEKSPRMRTDTKDAVVKTSEDMYEILRYINIKGLHSDYRQVSACSTTHRILSKRCSSFYKSCAQKAPNPAYNIGRHIR